VILADFPLRIKADSPLPIKIRIISPKSETQSRQSPDQNDPRLDASDVLEARGTLHAMISTAIGSS
jgi:hypothetical protein